MNKQEYDSLKSGDKLKIVSLEHTAVGDANFEIGEVVEFVEHLTGSSSKNDLLIKHSVGYRWYMSSKDLEVVEGEIEYKVGDEVVFIKYDNDREWERFRGGFVGGRYVIDFISTDSSLRLTNNSGACFYVDSTQIERCNRIKKSSKEDDLVNSPKHYATDPSGVECIQIKQPKPVKSDGGSSSYYFTKLPQHMIDKIVETGGIEIKDITRYVYDNDSDCKDITKALKRIQEWKKGGGKQGIDALYDANKIIFFAEELRESIKNDFGNKLN